MESVPVVASGIVRIDGDCAAVLSFSYGPIKIAANRGEAKCAVSLGRIRIHVNGPGGSFFCGGRTLGERLEAENTEPVVVISDSCVCERVLGINLDCVVVTLQRFGETAFRERVPVVTATQI